MRLILMVVVVLVSIISCGERGRPKESGSSELNANWLTGNWKRTNDEEGSQTFEVWQKRSEGVYEGTGWTMQNTDTVFKEDLRIARTDTIWNLEVRGVNEEPTYFRITEYSEESFTAENEQNEFPKKIIYSIKDKELTAVISDEENEIKFVFRRLTPYNKQ